MKYQCPEETHPSWDGTLWSRKGVPVTLEVNGKTYKVEGVHIESIDLGDEPDVGDTVTISNDD